MVVSLIIGVMFGLFVVLSSRNRDEDDVEDLLEDWDVQDHLEEVAEEEDLEEEQDAQDLMDLLFLDDEEDEPR